MHHPHHPARSMTTLRPVAETAVGSPPPAHLLVRWPDGREETIFLEQDEFVIGRARTADLVVPNELRYISGRHLLPRREGERYTVTDLQSTNGTRLNNERLSPGVPVNLRPQDILRICQE